MKKIRGVFRMLLLSVAFAVAAAQTTPDFGPEPTPFGYDSQTTPFYPGSGFGHGTIPPSYDSQTTPFYPEGSFLGDAFQRIKLMQSDITNSLFDFHEYEYNRNNNFEISDGGDDMYDNGNMVYFSFGGGDKRAEYNVYYSDPGNYEFASVTGWPFVALMYINNTYYHSHTYSIQVKGGTGADGQGNLAYFNNSAVSTTGNISVAYYVTQIYNANDPTICEVFFVLSEGKSINSFQAVRNSLGTDPIDSGAQLNNYPREVWLGYMLLSRKYGQYIQPYEVEHALSILASGVFDYYGIVHFDFQILPTQTTPTTTTYTPPRYTRYAYEGVRVTVCGNYRYSSQNITVCEGNMTGSLLQLTAVVPTPLGFSVPLQVDISGCSDNETCQNGCSDVQNISSNVSISQCRASCCSYSYCNYPYNFHGNINVTSPPNITIPQSRLPSVPVEILPNCFFKETFPRLATCVSGLFDSWPFSSTDQCKSSLLTAIRCGIDVLDSCRNTDMFSTALLQIPQNFNFSSALDFILPLGVSELFCEIPAEHLPFANFTVYGPYNSSYTFPVFPTSIGVGEPFCDNFIFDSLISWSIEYLTVLKTSRDRIFMCSSLKGLVNKVLNAVENRCDFEQLIAAFPCDSLTRNQLRALIVQAQEMLPQIVPDYCDGVEPPTEPARLDGDISLEDAFERIKLRQQDIRRSVYNFHNYEYSGNFQINDGGNDMYDGGNKVYFSSGNGDIRAEYNVNYSDPGNYEFSSVTGWPFVALMYINNTYSQSYAYSIQVKGDAGADGSGDLVYLSNSGISTTGNTSIAYFVTQIYNANDPTICEVFFALSEGEPVDADTFAAVRNSYSTNTLDSGVQLHDYPKDVWLGYMLLSRANGQYISPNQVEYALSILAAAILNYDGIVPFNFQIPSTQTPPTSTTTTYSPPIYTRYVYEGVRVSICGNSRFSFQNVTACESNMTGSRLQFTAVVPTPLGFSVPMQAVISECTDSESCQNGCSDLQNIVGNVSISYCRARCCSYSYCNYPYIYRYYYGYTNATTPPDITIPQSLLPSLPVEILPKCFFKQMFPRLVTCVSEVFNSWPFSSTEQCKSSLSTAIHCGIDIVSSCRTSDFLSTALAQIPQDFDFTTITDTILQVGVLDLLCTTPVDHLLFANSTTYGSYNFSFIFPVFPSPIGVGEPFCDKFILDSLISWSMEYMTVLQTSRDRIFMCSSLKGFVNKILDAVENRCDFQHLTDAFPCDSLTRNQLRALIVQAQEVLPQIIPDYCDGVEPPTEPERPDDIPLLPSCSLRQTISIVWTCEEIFTGSAPYSDSDVCKTNINRLLQCVANQLQKCGAGDGYNMFDNLYPGFTFNDIIEAIRALARPPPRSSYYYGSYHYYERSNFLEDFCSGASIHVPNFDRILETVFGVCRRNLTGEISDQITQAYYKYAGARNAADVCTAFRSLRDWFFNAFVNKCDFSLFQYYIPIQSPLRNFISHGIDILIDVLPELEISVCPKIKTNQTSVPTDWLKSYIRWRSHSLPRWQAAFTKWRSESEIDVTVEMPGCLDLTGVICQNPGMKTCVSDYYKCPICYCSDSKYKNLAGIVMTPWLQDYDSWQNFIATWEDKFDEWEQEYDY